MALFHAVVRIDHHRAQVLQFDPEKLQVRKVQAHTHVAGQHGGTASTEHEFFGEVCDELIDLEHVVVIGADAVLGDFRDFVESNRALLASRIVGWETSELPGCGQSEALARKYFAKHQIDGQRFSG
jgi:stalled ribosome rescue protein Dom34